MIKHTARRADDDFGSAAKFIDLAFDRLAAVDGDRMHFAAVRELDHFFADLHGEFARGDQDQGLRAVVFFRLVELFQLFQNRDDEGGGFGRCRCGLDRAGRHRAKARGIKAGLNGRGLRISSGHQRRHHRRGKIELFEAGRNIGRDGCSHGQNKRPSGGSKSRPNQEM